MSPSRFIRALAVGGCAGCPAERAGLGRAFGGLQSHPNRAQRPTQWLSGCAQSDPEGERQLRDVPEDQPNPSATDPAATWCRLDRTGAICSLGNVAGNWLGAPAAGCPQPSTRGPAVLAHGESSSARSATPQGCGINPSPAVEPSLPTIHPAGETCRSIQVVRNKHRLAAVFRATAAYRVKSERPGRPLRGPAPVPARWS